MSSIHFGQRSTLRLDALGGTQAAQPWSPDVTYAAGEIISGRYRLDSLLGAGGMGMVWRARDLATSTPVAIKLAANAGSRSESASRMLAEAELEAQLRHPGVVRALGFGLTQHGDAFIVMELLEGSSLRELLAERSRLSPDEATRMLLPIADALCFVHASGVIHRDIKPDNIFLATTERGLEPKILDFGIAKRHGGGSGTRDGMLVGSPGYMAPEQARAQSDLDERVDVWAFCLVLYESIAGSAALHPPDLATMLPHETYSLDVRPSLEAMAGSEALLRVVERGLAYDRQERYQSMWEVSRALRESLVRAPRRRRHVFYPLAA